MTVITISREIGSGAAYIALKLAERIGGTSVDKEIIHEIANKLGKQKEDLVDFDQETYSRIGVFFQEALASIAQGGKVFHPFGIGPLDWEGIDFYPQFPPENLADDDYSQVLVKVMQELAARDNVVILGRGGTSILSNYANAYHFRIVANREDRLLRLREEQEVSEDQASAVMARRDEAARKFMYDFFDVDWADPHHYHLTLNTSKIGLDKAVDVICSIISRER